MLVTTNPQQTLWETILPPGYQDLPKELAAVDELLDDPAFFEPYRVCKSLPGDPRFRACRLDRDGEGLVTTDNYALPRPADPQQHRRPVAATNKSPPLFRRVRSLAAQQSIRHGDVSGGWS